ncbi:HupE/UreJ family protein [Ideonella sp. DXS29W]|uniref:HupE/UreJ family protein n=1 Tax=Ideonella lacteola TaxID=2984193 RepID=A0ABU9BLR9_9BURK
MSSSVLSDRHLRRARLILAGLAALTAMALSPAPARAHAPSNATLSLTADGPSVQQRWDIALRDLDRVMPLDADDDGQITWGELRTAWPQISALADDGLHLSQPSGGAAPPAACRAGLLSEPSIEAHADGTYAVLERRWLCPADAAASGLLVDYRLFADSDASHRGLLQWRAGAQAAAVTAVLAPSSGALALTGTSPAAAAPAADGAPSSFTGFVAEGVHHILIGTDHVLFLLALMLPAVLLAGRADDTVRSASTPKIETRPARWTDALWQVAQVVTAFTVAHSITLALAVLGYADPPSRIVESLIAASVVLAALDNLKRFLPGARWKSATPGNGVPPPPSERGIGRFGAAVRWPMAFVFGLVHGFGFAGALKELGLDSAALAQSLIGFNLGVELGQLGIVAVALPLAWWIRDTRFYRHVVLAGGSLAIAAVAAVWFAERAFDVVVIG